MSRFSLEKLYTSLKQSSRGPAKIGLDPIGDWKIIFAIFTFLAIASLTIGVLLFLKVNAINETAIRVHTPPQILDKFKTDALQSVVEKMDERQSRSAQVKDYQKRLIDPSL